MNPISGPVLALHAGAGAIARQDLTPQHAAEIHAALADALRQGYAILTAGGSALDAVTATVVALENCPFFNAGHGATLNRDGVHELDASVMDGKTGRAGAIAGAQHIKNPVLAARALAEQADPLLLGGEAADAWAKAHGFEMVENSYYTTPSRQQALRHMLERERQGTLHQASERDKHGTVGAVALDRDGHLAAATSTGGFTAKTAGRIGDSPIIGAGTWADNRTCAISGTGKGEHFIRTALAHDIHARMLYAGATLEQAAQAAIEAVGALGGGAGLCAVDSRGSVILPFNTEGMYRGKITAEELMTGIHAEEIHHARGTV